jgi:hypothetical protein
VIDLIYFWGLDMVQSKVRNEANTLNINASSVWFNKLSKLADAIIRTENSSGMIGGVGHVVKLDESKFSKIKFQVGRVVRSPWIVGGIDYTLVKFFVETIYCVVKH